MRDKKRLVLAFLCLVMIFALVTVPAYAAESRHWWEAFSWFGDVANFIKSLVVPPANYFHNRLAKLNGMINAKFAGLGQLYQTLDQFFRMLADPAPISFTFRIPDNYLYRGHKGFSLDIFSIATPYLRFLRSFLTACCFLFTVVICYHKLRTFFTEEG